MLGAIGTLVCCGRAYKDERGRDKGEHLFLLARQRSSAAAAITDHRECPSNLRGARTNDSRAAFEPFDSRLLLVVRFGWGGVQGRSVSLRSDPRLASLQILADHYILAQAFDRLGEGDVELAHVR